MLHRADVPQQSFPAHGARPACSLACIRLSHPVRQAQLHVFSLLRVALEAEQ